MAKKKQFFFRVVFPSLYYLNGLNDIFNDSQCLSNHGDISLDLQSVATLSEAESALQTYFGQGFVQNPHIEFSSNIYP